MGHQQKLGSYGKNRIFGPKTEILGPKKRLHFLVETMFWPQPEKVVQRKKLPFQNKYQSLKNCGCFFGIKCFFFAKKHFLAQHKDHCFSIIPARARSVVILGHFFYGSYGPTKFR